MEKAFKVIKTISRSLMYVSYAAMLGMLGITVWDVIMRYIFNRPSSGVTEISQMFLIVAMTTMAHALIEGRFINVGVFVDKFPKKLNIGFEIGMGVAALVFFIIVGTQLLGLTETSIAIHEQYFILKTPRWPMYMVLAISFLACAMATVVFVIERIKNFKPPGEVDILDNPELAVILGTDKEDKKEGGDLS